MECHKKRKSPSEDTGCTQVKVSRLKCEAEEQVNHVSGWDWLPNELVELILLKVIRYKEPGITKSEVEESMALWIVCQYVCKEWRDMLPHPWISNHRFYHFDFAAAVAERGYLGLLKWARANGCPWRKTTCSRAAAGGHLEVIKWARANGCSWDQVTCSNAAEGGHLKVLKWARANGCMWDETACAAAAAEGNLKLLKWLRNAGCPWDSSTCSCAEQMGHVEVLTWARENGCAWDMEFLRESAYPLPQ